MTIRIHFNKNKKLKKSVLLQLIDEITFDPKLVFLELVKAEKSEWEERKVFPTNFGSLKL